MNSSEEFVEYFMGLTWANQQNADSIKWVKYRDFARTNGFVHLVTIDEWLVPHFQIPLSIFVHARLLAWQEQEENRLKDEAAKKLAEDG